MVDLQRNGWPVLPKEGRSVGDRTHLGEEDTHSIERLKVGRVEFAAKRV
jgi:hypothetical protein